MAPFRWPEVRHDLALATEVAKCFTERPQEWEDLAKRQGQAFSTESKLNLKEEVAENGWTDYLTDIKVKTPRP